MQHNRFRRSFTTFAIAVTGATGAVAAGATSASAGVSGPAFFVDHVLYRTVATPTDLSGTGAPAQSFDIIYSFGSLQRSVATAAPGYRDFNGGRWAVHALDAPNGYAAVLTSGDLDGNGVIDATDEVTAALTSGDLVDTGVARWFVCTVNKVPNGQA